jgi:HAE1 family hydrophobic/amphiphilic exporter-1
MAAVFIPVTFVQGSTGVFYKQFGVTLIIAILISAVNALTLSPALCALFLKPHNEEEELKSKNLIQRFYALFNRGFNATVNKYESSLKFLLKRKWIPALLLIIAVVGIFWASKTTPTGFVPNEDRSMILANIELPLGASLDRTSEIVHELYNKSRDLPAIEDAGFIQGRSLISGSGSNYGMAFIKLKELSERKDQSLSTDATIGKLFGIASTIKGANIIFFTPPSIPGFGFAGGFEVNLLDRFGGEFTELDKVNKEFIQALMKHPEIKYAQSSFNTNYPQYEMEVNVPLAKEKGVQINSIFSTLQGYIGGIYASDFARFGKQFRVYIQALPEDRANQDDLNSMYVRTDNGEMTPITQFVTLKRAYGPQSVTRFNLFNSTKLSGGTNPGFSSGDAIRVIEEEAAKLPSNYAVDYSGLTREEINAGSQTIFIFILSILFVYFLLCAQYESYFLPFAVICSLPLGVFGAYFSTKMMGLENNIYFQIALIMLIGLLAKNAILIVEFARQRRQQGESLVNSAMHAAKVRLRPILMTSFAFVFGLMPLVLAKGVGHEGNNSIGTGAVGGMFIGTILGIFVIPVLYVLFQWLQEKVTGKATIHIQNKED